MVCVRALATICFGATLVLSTTDCIVGIDSAGCTVAQREAASLLQRLPPRAEPTRLIKHILAEAAALEGGADSAASKALADIEEDVARGVDPAEDIAPGGRDHEEMVKAINEVSANTSVESSIKNDTLVTIDLIEEVSGFADTPEKADEEAGIVVQGDMLAENSTHLALIQGAAQKGFRWAGNLWPNGVLKYCFHKSAKAYEKITTGVRLAKEHIEKHTCIKLQEVSITNRDTCVEPGVVVVSGGGCSSYVGLVSVQGGGILTLHPYGCTMLGTVVHEFLHALGQTHEQSRPDRDDYVQILWQNIKSHAAHNFDLDTNGDKAIDYDFSSIMHYGDGDFAKERGLKTIVSRKPGRHTMGNRQGLTSSDINQLSRMYCGGGGGTPTQPIATPTPKPPTAARTTTSGCQCRATWVMSGGARCGTSCCNPDNDPNGEWCFTEPGCASDWGYCAKARPTPTATPTPTPKPTPTPTPRPPPRPLPRPPTSARTTTSGCQCRESWVMQGGATCDTFCCNPDNDQNGEWCFTEPGCASKWDYCADARPTPTTPRPTPRPTTGARTTTSGCQCRKAWGTNVGRCNSFCCNPDSDPHGEWCVTKPGCADNWGYCAGAQTPTLGPTPEPTGMFSCNRRRSAGYCR